MRSNGIAEGIVGTDEPFSVPAVLENCFLHLSDVLLGFFCFFAEIPSSEDFRIGFSVLDEHAGYKDALGHGTFAGACDLEAFTGMF